MKRIGIFVIAYNAECHLTQTLARIRPQVWEAVEVVFLIDDCSNDNTYNTAIAMQEHYSKLVVLRNQTNKRYGGNQKIGYQYAIDHQLDVVVMLHADGQYAPEIIMDIVKPILSEGADVVLGSRMLEKGSAIKGGMPRYKYHGNHVLTWIQNKTAGMSLSEFHSGYRAYSVQFLKSIPFLENSNEWHFDTQILLQAHMAKAKIVEVSIPTYYGNEICHVNGMLYAGHCILEVFLYQACCMGLVYSRTYDLSTASGHRYGDKFCDPGSSHSIIWKHLKALDLREKQVLELGVGDASLTRKLCESSVVVDVCESDPDAAVHASAWCRTLMIADIEEYGWSTPSDGLYDIVIAADVLEHLVHPEETLIKLKNVCKQNGILVASLPNFVNIYVRINILLGRIPIYCKGLFDQGHLHLFTRKQMRSILQKTGWVVEKAEITTIPLCIVFPFLKKEKYSWFLSVVRNITRWFPSLLGYQEVFICRNPNDAGVVKK